MMQQPQDQGVALSSSESPPSSEASPSSPEALPSSPGLWSPHSDSLSEPEPDNAGAGVGGSVDGADGAAGGTNGPTGSVDWRGGESSGEEGGGHKVTPM